MKKRVVIPAKAGIQQEAASRGWKAWMPAYAGMTGERIPTDGNPATIAG